MKANVGSQQTVAMKEITSLEEFGLRPSMSKHITKVAEKCMLSVVNTSKFGKRLAMALELYETIGGPKHVSVFLSKIGIAISATGEGEKFPVKTSANKKVVYSSLLVSEITDAFGLDFEGRTSISFHDVTYLKKGDDVIAFIKMVPEQPSSDDALVASSPQHDSDQLAIDADSNEDEPEIDEEEYADSEEDEPEIDEEEYADSEEDEPEIDEDEFADSEEDEPEIDEDEYADSEEDEPEIDEDEYADSEEDELEIDEDEYADSEEDEPEINEDGAGALPLRTALPLNKLKRKRSA